VFACSNPDLTERQILVNIHEECTDNESGFAIAASLGINLAGGDVADLDLSVEGLASATGGVLHGGAADPAKPFEYAGRGGTGRGSGGCAGGRTVGLHVHGVETAAAGSKGDSGGEGHSRAEAALATVRLGQTTYDAEWTPEDADGDDEDDDFDYSGTRSRNGGGAARRARMATSASGPGATVAVPCRTTSGNRVAVTKVNGKFKCLEAGCDYASNQMGNLTQHGWNHVARADWPVIWLEVGCCQRRISVLFAGIILQDRGG
jgi:hypothetical protein